MESHDSENQNCIVRFGPPNEMDKFPYGTRIKVIKDPDHYDIYLQSSTDEEIPAWISIGPFKIEIENICPDN